MSFRTVRSLCAFAAIWVGMILAPIARADFVGLLNIDFGEAPQVFPNEVTPRTLSNVPSLTYVGSGVIGTATDVWNGPTVPFAYTGHQTGATGGFVNSTGAATGVGVTYDVTGGFNSFAASSPYDRSPLKELMRDYLYDRNDTVEPGTLTLTGLTPNGIYDLYLYSAGDVAKQTTFTVNGVDQIATFTALLDPTTFHEGYDYVKYTAIADGSGNLNIIFHSTVPGEYPTTVNDGVLNGLQLLGSGEVAPAPLPPVVLGGLVGLGLAWPAKRWLRK